MSFPSTPGDRVRRIALALPSHLGDQVRPGSTEEWGQKNAPNNRDSKNPIPCHQSLQPRPFQKVAWASCPCPSPRRPETVSGESLSASRLISAAFFHPSRERRETQATERARNSKHLLIFVHTLNRNPAPRVRDDKVQCWRRLASDASRAERRRCGIGSGCGGREWGRLEGSWLMFESP